MLFYNHSYRSGESKKICFVNIINYRICNSVKNVTLYKINEAKLYEKKKLIKTLSPSAYRALQEANERNLKKANEDLPKELGGRDGPEPTRFGDWEKKGIVSDF